jgi:hypothetical protein
LWDSHTDIRRALEENVGEYCDIEVPMSEHALEHALSNFPALLGALTLHARDGKFAFVFGQPPHLGASRETRVQEEASDTNRQTD